jgi:hypothetical protein
MPPFLGGAGSRMATNSNEESKNARADAPDDPESDQQRLGEAVGEEYEADIYFYGIVHLTNRRSVANF